MLIVITLLGFVVVLLVGLAAYTRIETAVAGNTQRQAQARENALLGLNVALGQLQKYAGPDQRVTATADAFPNGAGTTHYTGVWSSDPASSGQVDPLTWLVSRNELTDTGGAPAPLAITPLTNVNTTNGVALVSNKTSRTANDVLARLMPITATGVPGMPVRSATTIGRYAWWVGDNGVKADVARTDLTSRLNYEPFVDSAGATVSEMRTRLFQQTGQGAGPFDTASSTDAFDPRDNANLPIAPNALTAQQIPFLKISSTTPVGLAVLKTHYHNWTVGNHAVLARTNAPAGQSSLRNDLSLNPGALGTAFTAWADYPSYMESPEANPLAATLPQPANALRRRYKMTPAVTDTNGSQFSVAPVLSYLALGFSLRNNGSTTATATNLECSMRCVAEFWNPYTGALVPEDLEIRITGLQPVTVRDDNSPDPTERVVDLQQLMGDTMGGTGILNNPIRFSLPWTVSQSDDEHASWLPGRVYNWSAESNGAAPDTGSNPMLFETRDFQTAGRGVVRDAGPPLAASVGSTTTVLRQCFMFNPVTLQVELVRVSDGVTLATFQSPAFSDFSGGSIPTEVSHAGLDFAFVFRLLDPTVDSAPWLQTTGLDPRLVTPPTAPLTLYTQPGNAQNPALMVQGSTPGINLPTIGASNPTLLLDRYPGTATSLAGTSFNEDVPLFELPRSPLLSLGQLQHLSLPAQRPFWIGSSAASTGPVEWSNALFDQHFFSGLGRGSNWTDVTRPLPNTLARVLRHKPDGTSLAATDFTTDGLSARYLLQGGAFNLNSTDPDAWAAVLRSVRFPSVPPNDHRFEYLDASASTGTNTETTNHLKLAAEAAFPRFSQSAQETYKESASTYSQSEPPPSSGTILHTEYYRQGFRALDAATVTALAQNISAAVKTRLAASGPFRSLEEFLNPATGAGTPSLLEQAIIDLQLNADPNNTEGGGYPFSSTTLTQADIVTALAPVLFVRSDTFTIRAYGEAINPATGAAEGKAWCEAIVQRFPEPFSPATAGQPIDDEYKIPPGDFGRRFKIIYLRWLTKSDI